MPSVSIIVPVLNESALIGPFLEHLRATVPDAEVIVVDGGSNDGTAELAGLADRVLRVARGRARQMNAGAAVARGEVFWFLHADSIVPANALSEITKVLGKAANVGGCFRLRLPGREWIYRVSDSLGNIGVHVFGFALGDHGMFCRRDAFFAARSFPDIPLMEDAELYRALRRLGRMRQVSSEIIGNPRRYQDLGPYRTTGYYVLILTLYLFGARISTLMSVYRRLTGPYSAKCAGSDSAASFSRSTTAPVGVRQ
ncbi:MAG: glycosyl transferase [Chthoniobacterales bacterium]|nr:MAG: glycosyl transferase [Chthoniobacterales bacterium]